MDLIIKIHTCTIVRLVHCTHLWVISNVHIPINVVFLSLKIDFVSANSEHPDEMGHYATFLLGIHCLHPFLKGLMIV